MKRKTKENIPFIKPQNRLFQLFLNYSPLLAGFISFLICISALNNAFVNWDDNHYIYDNQQVINGEWKELITKPVQGNYHPLTMLSLGLEYYFFRDNPFYYHLDNLILHAVNVVLVFILSFHITQSHTKSWFIALGFGLHPLHVESFAWISGRKDLLFTLFSFLTLIAWSKYLSQRKNLYLASLIVFALLALASKPIAIILPLLCLIYYYFFYMKSTLSNDRNRNEINTSNQLPLHVWVMYGLWFLLIIFWTFLIYNAQENEGAIRSIPQLGMGYNILVAMHGLLLYMVKGLIPWGLSALYPYPPIQEGIPLMFWLSIPFIIILIYLIQRFGKKWLHLHFGFVFMLISLIPVLQFIPAGSAIAADRYFYLPAWGFLFALAYVPGYLNIQRYAFIIGAGLLFYWAILTIKRIPIWENGQTLFTDILKKYPGNPIAANNLGMWLNENKRKQEACQWFETAVKSKPDFPQALFNLAVCKFQEGRVEDAKELNLKAIQYSTDYAEAWNNLGTCYGASGLMDSAGYAIQYSLKLKPQFADAWNNYGMYFIMKENRDSARICFEKAIHLNPDKESDARSNLQYLNAGY